MNEMLEMKDASGRRFYIGKNTLLNEVVFREQDQYNTYMVFGTEKIYFKRSFEELIEDVKNMLNPKKKPRTRTSEKRSPQHPSSELVSEGSL